MTYSKHFFFTLALFFIVIFDVGISANNNYDDQEQRYKSLQSNLPVIIETDLAQPRYRALIYPGELDVIAAVLNGSFVELEEYFSKLHHRFEVNDDIAIDNKLELAYRVFENTDPKLEEKYQLWISSFPKSHTAHTALGYFYLNIANAKRGTRFMSKTEDHQKQGLYDYLGLAEKNFLTAVELFDQPIFAIKGLLAIYNLISAHEEFYEVLKYGLYIRPTSFTIRKMAMYALQPKWGGSFYELKEFIQESRRVYVPDDERIKFLESYFHWVQADITQRNDELGAIQHYDAAVQNSGHWYYLYRRGVNYYHLKEYSKALTDLDLAVQLAPYIFGPREKRAWVYEKLGKSKEAIQDLNIALEIDALDAGALKTRGKLHRKLGNTREAEIDLTNSLVFGSTDKWKWHWLAEVYIFDYKNYKKAEDVIKRGLQFHPQDNILWYDLAVAQSQIINCEVMDTFQKYLKVCENTQCDAGDKNWILNAQQIFISRKKCG